MSKCRIVMYKSSMRVLQKVELATDRRRSISGFRTDNMTHKPTVLGTGELETAGRETTVEARRLELIGEDTSPCSQTALEIKGMAICQALAWPPAPLFRDPRMKAFNILDFDLMIA